jgi:hypothetical protein
LITQLENLSYISHNRKKHERSEPDTERIIYNTLACADVVLSDVGHGLGITNKLQSRLTDKLKNDWVPRYIAMLKKRLTSRPDGNPSGHEGNSGSGQKPNLYVPTIDNGLRSEISPGDNNIKYIVESIVNLYPNRGKLIEILGVGELKDLVETIIEKAYAEKVLPEIMNREKPGIGRDNFTGIPIALDPHSKGSQQRQFDQ